MSPKQAATNTTQHNNSIIKEEWTLTSVELDFFLSCFLLKEVKRLFQRFKKKKMLFFYFFWY